MENLALELTQLTPPEPVGGALGIFVPVKLGAGGSAYLDPVHVNQGLAVLKFENVDALVFIDADKASVSRVGKIGCAEREHHKNRCCHD